MPMIANAMPKTEINLRRLLSQCEKLVKDDTQINWRIEKYILSLDEMLKELKELNTMCRPHKDTMSDYERRVTFLKGLILTQKLTGTEDAVIKKNLSETEPWTLNPVEKVTAVSHLPHGTNTISEVITKEIHQKTTSKYNQEVRNHLFRNVKGPISSLRQRKQNNNTSTEDLDSKLKHHHLIQENIANDMLILARNLKEQSQLANKIINKDIESIEKSSKIADQNYSKLKVESARLDEHTRRAWKCWMWVILAFVMIVFISMLQ